MENLLDYWVNESIQVSKHRIIQYAEILKKRIKARNYEIEDVIVDGEGGRMAIEFNTGLSLLLSGDNTSIVGFKTSKEDSDFYPLPKVITGFKTLEKHIKLLKLTGSKKPKPVKNKILFKKKCP